MENKKFILPIELVGGPGSGHFGHKGRPEKVGGSLPKGLDDILYTSTLGVVTTGKFLSTLRKDINRLDPLRKHLFQKNIKQLHLTTAKRLGSPVKFLALYSNHYLTLAPDYLKLNPAERLGVLVHELAHSASRESLLWENLTPEVRNRAERRAYKHVYNWATWAEKGGIITEYQAAFIRTNAYFSWLEYTGDFLGGKLRLLPTRENLLRGQPTYKPLWR